MKKKFGQKKNDNSENYGNKKENLHATIPGIL